MGIQEEVSKNFQAAKALAILFVCIGHYFKEIGILWIPVTICLILFSWSSAYFTGLKYQGDFDKKMFWGNKVKRLLFRMLIINLFLCMLFIWQDKNGIFTWHSLINVLGFNGILNWLRIPNQSPFGAGMWYFTLLILFYIAYPLIELMNRKKTVAAIFVILSVSGALVLEKYIIYSHSLWLSLCGYLMGAYNARSFFKFNQKTNLIMIVLLTFFFLMLNTLWKFNSMNSIFILLISLFVICFLHEARFPNCFFVVPGFISSAIFEVYLIHPYVMNHFTGLRSLDFIIYLTVVIAIAKTLSYFSSQFLLKLERSFF